MEVLALKLNTGEDVMGEIVSDLNDTDVIILENPVGIAVVRGQNGQPNVGLTPFPLHGKNDKGQLISFAKKNVTYYYTPADDFITNYKQIFTGLVVPTEKKLITG
jgi:hypothetical protein